MPDARLALNCWVIGYPNLFSVKMRKSETVHKLKEVIRVMAENQHTIRDIDALDLWKVSIPDTDFDAKLKSISAPGAVDGAVKLSHTRRLSDYFPAKPTSGHIHIVVQLPAVGGDVSKPGQGGNDDMGPRGDGGPSTDTKRKSNEPAQKSHEDTEYEAIEIPLATLSTEKQLHLSKSLRIGDTYMCIHDGFYDTEVTAILKPVFPSSSHFTIPEPLSSPAPSTSTDSSMGSIEFPSPTQHNPFSLCLTQKLGKGAIGEVWKGVFSSELESTTVLDVAAKVGWFEDSPERFLREAKIYDILQHRDVEGVPVLIGLFDDISDRVPILVTTYAGQIINRVDDALKQQFRQILQDLHKAGICHGDLRKDNMCCLNGRGSIIDFSHAFESRADQDFATDVQKLEELLAC